MPVGTLKRRLLAIYAVLLAGSIALVTRRYFLGREVTADHVETGSRIGELAELTAQLMALFIAG